MWHWNSLWAHGPGDPPPIDDPVLWRSPWSLEQSIALQARTWDTIVTASHSWWSFWMAAMPLPTWPQIGQVAPPSESQATLQWPVPDTHGGGGNEHHAERIAAERAAPRRAPVPRKRAEHPEARHHAATARKR